jgi:hypothetical protein
MIVLSWLVTTLLAGAGVSLAGGSATGDTRALQQGANIGVFDRAPDDWEANSYIDMGTTSEGYTVFERDPGFAYYVNFEGNVTVLAQLVVLEGSVSFDELENFATNNWLPPDADMVDEFQGVLVEDNGPQMRVQLWYSDTLFEQGISRSGIVLVTYGAPSGSSGFDRVSVSIGT